MKASMLRHGHPEPEHWLLRWAFWSMIFALAIGGRPWRFPQGGRLWVEQRLFSREPNVAHKPSVIHKPTFVPAPRDALVGVARPGSARTDSSRE